MIAAGLAHYRLQAGALRILTGLFDACLWIDLYRLPELFCGFARHAGQGPTLYPVACSPQAWASASVFLILQACLGLSFNHSTATPQIRFAASTLPHYLDEVRIHNLTVGEASVDLVLQRHPQDVGLQVTRRQGDIEIVVVK